MFTPPELLDYRLFPGATAEMQIAPWYKRPRFFLSRCGLSWRLTKKGMTPRKHKPCRATGYIASGGSPKTATGVQRFHNAVWNTFNGPPPPGFEVDHIDHVRHHCALDNLRLRAKGVNRADTTGAHRTGVIKRVILVCPDNSHVLCKNKTAAGALAGVCGRAIGFLLITGGRSRTGFRVLPAEGDTVRIPDWQLRAQAA